MLYTDKNIYIDTALVEKLDILAERSGGERKLDAILICDGDEGFGKTGISIICAYYLSIKMNRPFNLSHIFFDPDEFVKFINSTKKQIIVWDEAALGGLAVNWMSKVQQMIIQTLMTCRYRQHIIIFNCPKFYRLANYFVVDRAVGLLHVYSRDNFNAGWFTYYKKDMLEGMYNYWTRLRKKPYKKFPHIHGTFPDAFKKDIIDEEEYIKKKDVNTQKVIAKYSAANVVTNKIQEKLIKLQYHIYKFKGLTQEEKATHFGVPRTTIKDWRYHPEKYPELFKDPQGYNRNS